MCWWFYVNSTSKELFKKKSKGGEKWEKKEDEFPQTEEILQDHRPENTSQKDRWDKEVKSYCI